MMDYMDKAVCTRLANRIGADAYGTKYHMYGFLPGMNDVPRVHEEFEIVYEPTWFYRIKRKDDQTDGWT